jgi:hypothetical protein
MVQEDSAKALPWQALVHLHMRVKVTAGACVAALTRRLQ